MLEHLGPKIRKLRKEKGLTLIEIAQKTGIAQATLSRIETGTMIGTVESHAKIAELLGVGLPDLYAGADARAGQTTHTLAAKKIIHHDKNMHWELLAPENPAKKMMPAVATLQPGAETHWEEKERGVEKFIYGLEGEMTVRIEQNEYPLKPGETLYFEASLPHQLVNPSNRPAKALIAVSRP